jgi:pimeloyl-ACP methyl ester carboxylesterase
MPTVTSAVFAPQPVPQDYLEAARIPLVLRPSAFEANAQDVAGPVRRRHGAERPLPRNPPARDRDRRRRRPHRLYRHPLTLFAREVPGTKLMILPGMGHMPHYAAQDLIVAETEALTRRLGGTVESRAAAP